MICILHSGLVTKYNQISQTVDATAHCPITIFLGYRRNNDKIKAKFIKFIKYITALYLKRRKSKF